MEKILNVIVRPKFENNLFMSSRLAPDAITARPPDVLSNSSSQNEKGLFEQISSIQS